MMNFYRDTFLALCAVVFAFVFCASSVLAADDDTTLAVTDFYDTRQGDDHKWLGIALSDMLIADLAGLARVTVLDREHLRVYFNEAELNRYGYVGRDDALKLGGVAKADKVLTGSYTVTDDGGIRIDAVLVDINSREAEQTQSVEGKFSDLFALQAVMAQKIAADFGQTTGNSLQPSWTSSLDAASHYYEGLRLYELGQRETALAEMRTALKTDKAYFPAQFWAARVYSEIGEYGHAVLTLQASLQEKELKRLYRYHMTLLLAEIHHRFLDETDAAIALLEKLHPDYAETSFERLNARYRLAVLYEAAGRQADAHRTYYAIGNADGSAGQVLKLPYKSVKLSSGNELKRYAKQRYPLTFFKAFYKSSEAADPPPEIILLTPENPEHVIRGRSRESLYIHLLKGYNFKHLKLILPAANISHRFPTISTFWPDFTKKGVVTRLYKTKQVEGRSVRTFNLWAKITPAVMIHAGAPDGMRIVAEFGPDISHQYIRADGSWTNPMIDNHFAYPKLLYAEGHEPGHAELFEDDESAMWLLYDNHNNKDQHSRGEDADLWMFHSTDKQDWSRPKRLNRVNSTADDTMPNLLRDGAKKYRLLFVSNRSGADELWLSSSPDGLTWKGARRLQIPHDEKLGVFLSGLTVPRFVQDQHGAYHIAFYHKASRRVMLTSSHDLVTWKQPTVFYEASKQPGIALFLDNMKRLRIVVGDGSGRAQLGISSDGVSWRTSDFPLNPTGVINAIQDKRDHFAVVYGPGGFHQAASNDWREWSVDAFPSGPYTVSRAGEGDILQDREGYYWIALPKDRVNKIQLFRLKAYPAETLLGALEPLNGELPEGLKAQFELEEAAWKAKKAGKWDLWSCINEPEHLWTWKLKCLGQK